MKLPGTEMHQRCENRCQLAHRGQTDTRRIHQKSAAKLNRIIFLHRRDRSINSARLPRSSPISRTPANSCAISVPEPTAIGTSAPPRRVVRSPAPRLTGSLFPILHLRLTANESEGVMRDCVLVIFLCAASRLAAQDPFEIHVYEYEPMSLGQYSLEAHLNITAQGSSAREGTLLPASQQTHLTLEPTVGLSPEFAVGFMFLNAWQPCYSPQFAGSRVLPHFYLPESWGLPVRIGFVSEFSFQNTRYEENSRRVELRPILDREFKRWQIVFNPVFERALHGPGTEHGWNFEPALLLRWRREKFSPSMEYYGEIESISAEPYFQPEVHQLFLGGDWEASPGFLINMGVGFDLGERGPGIVLKSRFEWHWGEPRNHP